MNEVLQEWRYTHNVPESRRKDLAAPGSYDDLVQLVFNDISIVKVIAKPGNDSGLTDCVQTIFGVDLPKTGDALFNGPWGYRAQYYSSAGQGLAGNVKLLSKLTPKLLGAVDTNEVPGLAKIDVCASLLAASAKIWIQEIPSLLINPTRDLDVDRWSSEADNNVKLAKWGLSAPEVSRFEIKGALIDPYGNEVVPCQKIRRHYDIYHYGFS